MQHNATGIRDFSSKASGPTSLHEYIVPSSVIEERTGREAHHSTPSSIELNPLNAELNPICHLLTLLGANHFLHVSRIRVEKDC